MNTGKKIHISGMHSGQNPCSGVGIARCLRKGLGEATLVGVDHWQGSSGLHDDSVDEILLLPQWKQINDGRHVDQVRALLDEGHLWISALDMEVYWLSEKLGPHENLLSPGGRALELTSKPMVQALNGLDFRVPDFITASLPDSEIHRFLRHNSWQCWLKSPYHDARRISSWFVFERAREMMSRSWMTSRLYVQRHVTGNEETIAFAAYRGELLGAIHLQKRQLTPEGKTWAGRVTPVEPELMEHFREAVRRTEWSGGGELEYVVDPDGQRWIIECNPRFPAWIYGGALAGFNLPARLVSRVWDLPVLESTARYPFFTRVVQEIPAREEVGIPLPPDPGTIGWAIDGKKGKGSSPGAAYLPRLREALSREREAEEEVESAEEPVPPRAPEPVPAVFQEEVARIAATFGGDSPARVHLEEWVTARFDHLASAVRAARGRRPEVRIGYSIKTSPTDDFIRKAKERGFYAECISQMEIRRALESGYRNDQVILNGPGKFWPITRPPESGLHMLFCDSVEEFDRVFELKGIAECLGFRMRIPRLHSRFGNPLDDFESFERIVDCVRRMKGRGPELGFHFHMPSWAIGVKRWGEALQSLLIWCRTVEQLTGVPVRRLDLGGGFFPADLERLDFPAIQDMVASELPQAEGLYFEPGRALTQDGEVLVTRVLDVRRTSDGELLEAVVDGCIAELPLAQAYSHRVYFMPRQSEGVKARCRLLEKGDVRLLGRICMEDDILSAGVDLPDTLAIGDQVIFGDAGGYERSMSYVFGRG